MKKILFTILLTGAVACVFAQSEAQTKRGPYLTNKFFDNWFISAGGGVNVYWGEADDHNSIGDRIAPALDIAVGKWITPSVGLRARYSGLSAAGASEGRAPFSTGNADAEGFFKEEFDFMSLNADAMWNLSSAIGGYKPSRTWEFIPFAGFGLAVASKDDIDNKELAFSAGLLNKIRLSPAFDLNLEMRGLIVADGFDEVVPVDGSGDGMLTATLGLTYKFNKRNFDRPKVTPPADYTPYNNRIKALENDLTSSQARAKQLADELAAAKNRPVETKTAEVIIPQTAIFFELGKATLSEKETVNLGYLADAIKKSNGRKFTLSGSSDSTTGSAKRNLELSKQRAQSVYDTLVKKYGVDASQLEIVANGSSNEPFAKNKPSLNRVVITQ